MAIITWVDTAKVDFDNSILSKIEEEANLPAGKITIVFYNKNLTNDSYAICISYSLIKYAPRSSRVISSATEKSWDCGVVLPKETCEYTKKYPAFFTYLIGHELGHAHICLTNLKLHIFSCLVDLFIKDASDNKITKHYELPHEKRFDQFGIYIAEHIFSRDKLNDEIMYLLKDPDRKDHQRLEAMLSLKSTNMLDGLKDELISLTTPYKDKFIELSKQNIVNRHGNSIASEIDDFGTLFE